MAVEGDHFLCEHLLGLLELFFANLGFRAKALVGSVLLINLSFVRLQLEHVSVVKPPHLHYNLALLVAELDYVRLLIEQLDETTIIQLVEQTHDHFLRRTFGLLWLRRSVCLV